MNGSLLLVHTNSVTRSLDYLAIYDHEILPNSKKIAKVGAKLCQILGK